MLSASLNKTFLSFLYLNWSLIKWNTATEKAFAYCVLVLGLIPSGLLLREMELYDKYNIYSVELRPITWSLMKWNKTVKVFACCVIDLGWIPSEL